jgi:hypothetical protein
VDPLHNLPPSKSFGYKINPSSPLNCQLTQLQMAVAAGVAHCSTQNCKAVSHINDALAENTYSEAYGVVLVKVEKQETLDEARLLLEEKKAGSYAEIFEAGVMYLQG